MMLQQSSTLSYTQQYWHRNWIVQQVEKDKGPVAMEMDKGDSMKAEDDEDAQIYSKVSDVGL